MDYYWNKQQHLLNQVHPYLKWLLLETSGNTTISILPPGVRNNYINTQGIIFTFKVRNFYKIMSK